MEPLYQVIFTAITSFVICFFSIPAIIRVADLKHLYDEPSERKKHSKNIPTLGGVAIFAGSIFSTTFWSSQDQIVELQYIIASLLILFFLGIKDDIVDLPAYKKLIGQVLAAAILVFFADIRLSSLYGVFSIYDIPFWFSSAFSLITIIGITNSFNLIDGIDTLAASVGLFSSILFGSWFYLTGFYQYSVLAFSITGALMAFYYFNKTPAKIFMGDTGSLVIGLISSILAIKFMEFNKVYPADAPFKMFSAPAIAIAVLIIPIFDTIRVFVLRILQGRSPLSPDRNHLHHILIDLGYSHLKSTFVLISCNIVVVAISYYFQRQEGELVLLFNLILMVALSYYLERARKQHQLRS